MGVVVLVLVLGLVGCGSPEPVPTPMPPPPARAKAKGPTPSVRSKAKTGNMVHSKAKGKAKAPRGKAPGRRPAPIGGPGEVKGHLVLESKETPAAEGKPAGTVTTANMVLAWGEEKTALVLLGEVAGTCASVDPKPVGPEGGQQHNPLWTVSCTHDGTSEELYILQAKSLLAVVRGAPGTNKPMVYKPVRRVPLHPSAKLVRSDEAAPKVAEAAPAPAPTPAPAPAPVAPDEGAAPAPAPSEPAPAPSPAPAPPAP